MKCSLKVMWIIKLLLFLFICPRLLQAGELRQQRLAWQMEVGDVWTTFVFNGIYID